jgi:hypothetical protein
VIPLLPHLRRSLPALGFALLLGCANSSPQPGAPSATILPSAAPIAPASASPPLASASASAVAPTASAAAPGVDAAVDAGAPDAAVAAAPAAPAPPFAADNNLPPTEGPELQDRAKSLLDAVIHDEPQLGDSFWFPKEPFIPLKDVKGPDKYWEQLHRTYGNDVHALHKKRKSWTGVVFEKFEIGSKPKWVKPGEEANKIGYHRSFRGKLHYTVDGQSESFEVRTVITWQGRWYITHLSKFKH